MDGGGGGHCLWEIQQILMKKALCPFWEKFNSKLQAKNIHAFLKMCRTAEKNTNNEVIFWVNISFQHHFIPPTSH